MIFRGFGNGTTATGPGFYLTLPQFSSLTTDEQALVLTALGISAPVGTEVGSAVPNYPITASMFLSFPVQLQFDILNVIATTTGQASALASILTPAQIAALDPSIQSAYGAAIALAMNPVMTPAGSTPVAAPGSTLPVVAPVTNSTVATTSPACSFWQTPDATTGACDTNYILLGGVALALYVLFGMHGQ